MLFLFYSSLSFLLDGLFILLETGYLEKGIREVTIFLNANIPTIAREFVGFEAVTQALFNAFLVAFGAVLVSLAYFALFMKQRASNQTLGPKISIPEITTVPRYLKTSKRTPKKSVKTRIYTKPAPRKKNLKSLDAHI